MIRDSDTNPKGQDCAAGLVRSMGSAGREAASPGLGRTARMLEATTPRPFDPPRDDHGRFTREPLLIEEYWRNPEPFEAEQAAMRAQANAALDACMRKNHPHIGGNDDGR